MNLNVLLEFLNSLGLNLSLNINEESSPIILFALSILVLSLISLLCILNIILYLCIFYVSDNKVLLDKVSQYSWILFLFNLYKKTRLFYIVFEFILLLVCIISISWLCWNLIYGLTH